MNDNRMTDAFSAMNRICGDLPYTVEDRYYEMLDHISIAIVDYRVCHKLSQKQLADQLGVSQAMVSKYESGDYNISLKALMELFDKLSIPLSISIGKESQSQSESPVLIPHSGYRRMQNDAVIPTQTDITPESAA